MKEEPDLENYLPKSFFQGTQESMAKLPKVQKLFRKFGKLCPFMSALNEQQLVFVCSHILKLNKAKCVHSLPQKRGLRPKPVPGRGCPSLKLRLSSWGLTARARITKPRWATSKFWSFKTTSLDICCELHKIRRSTDFEALKL